MRVGRRHAGRGDRWQPSQTDPLPKHPDPAIAELLPVERPLWTLELAASLLVERPDGERRTAALDALRRWEPKRDSPERSLWEWLVAKLG
jgi:hypothetical protein